MYQASKPRNNASIKVTDITIAKCIKVLQKLSLAERNHQKICKFSFATGSLRLVSTNQQLTLNR